MAIIYSKEQLSTARNRQTDKYKNSFQDGFGYAGPIKNQFGYVKGDKLFEAGSKKPSLVLEGSAHLTVKSEMSVKADVIKAGKTKKYPFSKQGDQIKLITIDSEAVYQQYAAELDFCFTGFESEYEGGFRRGNKRGFHEFAGTKLVEIDGKIVGFLRPQLGQWTSHSDLLSGGEILENFSSDSVKNTVSSNLHLIHLYKSDIIPYVSEIYVKPEYRGHGVATRMYQVAQSIGVKMLMISLKQYLQKPDYFAKLYPFATLMSTIQMVNDKIVLLLCTEDFIHLNDSFVPNSLTSVKQLLNRWFSKQSVTARTKFLKKEIFEQCQEQDYVEMLIQKKTEPTQAELEQYAYYYERTSIRDSRLLTTEYTAKLSDKWFRKYEASDQLLIKILKNQTPIQKFEDSEPIDSSTKKLIEEFNQHQKQNKITQFA